MFGLNYIKNGKLPAEFGRLYSQLQTMREESDYNCIYDITPDELKEKIEPAKRMITTIKTLIDL